MASHKDMNARLAFRLPMDVAESWRTAARASELSLSDWVRAQVRVDGQDRGPLRKRKKSYVKLNQRLSGDVWRVGEPR